MARQLYGTADYPAALEMLDRLAAGTSSLPERQSIDLYRIFCLVALGKTGEADEVISAMITRDPLHRPADADVPPRVRPMFSDRRRTLLPMIVRSKYELAKRAFDMSDYKTAAADFSEVSMMLSDPDLAGPASQSLADLRVLTDGFNELAVRAIASQTASPAVPTPEPAPAEAAPAVAVPALKIYDINDLDVTPPATVKQDIPRFSRPVLVERKGLLVVVIDDRGSVESAIISEQTDRAYDQMLLAAAKTWMYRPATRAGVPVKYRKRIQVTLPRQGN